MLYPTIFSIFFCRPLDAMFFVDDQGDYFFHMQTSKSWLQMELKIDALGYYNLHDQPAKEININGKVNSALSGLDVKVALAKPTEGEIVEFYVPTIFLPRETPVLGGEELMELPPVSFRWKVQMFLTELKDRIRGTNRKK